MRWIRLDKKILIFIILIILLMAGFLKFTGQSVFVALNKQGGVFAIDDEGGRTDYNIEGVGSFVQCFDADPSNQMTVKSVCHAQFYDLEKKKLIGVNAVDFCRSGGEVVDFYCGKDRGCEQLVGTCSEGLACVDGKCVEKKSVVINEYTRGVSRFLGDLKKVLS